MLSTGTQSQEKCRLLCQTARVPLKMRADSFHQILPYCNLKAKWLPRNSWSRNYKNGYNFKDSEGKAHVKFCVILQEGRALRFPEGFGSRSFDKHSL
jgi:hypothetical protein